MKLNFMLKSRGHRLPGFEYQLYCGHLKTYKINKKQYMEKINKYGHKLSEFRPDGYYF